MTIQIIRKRRAQSEGKAINKALHHDQKTPSKCPCLQWAARCSFSSSSTGKAHRQDKALMPRRELLEVQVTLRDKVVSFIIRNTNVTAKPPASGISRAGGAGCNHEPESSHEFNSLGD